MESSLSNLANIFVEDNNEIECKYGHGNKNYKKCGTKRKDFKGFLEYANFKDDLTEYKCFIKNVIKV